jgi:hypothetical protein
MTIFTASVQSLPNQFAAGPAHELLVKSGVLELGDVGAQFSVNSPERAVFFDHFLGDLIADEWDLQEGTDSATGAAAILAGGIGGVLRITTGDAGTGLAADMEQLTTGLQWQASNGNLVMEVKAKLSAITVCYVFIGFTDLAASLEAPIESAGSANTLTSNASNAVGFMFDTRMTDDKWWLVGVKADTDATHQDTTFAPVADTYAKFRIEVDTDGVATFYYNGTAVGTTMTDAITAATDLTPTINVSKTATAASMTMDVDYVYVAMDT